MSKKIKAGGLVLMFILGLILGIAANCIYSILDYERQDFSKYYKTNSSSSEIVSSGDGEIIIEGDLQIHFLELGNKYTGDCTYIKAGDNDILIDAGSKSSSIDTISTYLDKYMDDDTLEYVIVTHAHEDHYAGFSVRNGSLFDKYECENIITFAKTNQTDKGTSNMYGRFLLELQDEVDAGANYKTCLEMLSINNGVVDLGKGITMTILNSKYYTQKASTENDYSVCTLFTYGTHNYLFTGDLEEDGEEELVKLNTIPKVDVYKAGHHGSKTSSTKALLDVIDPEVVCVCCCAGSSEYTKTNENQFPTQTFINNVAPHTDKVYVTTLCVDYANNKFQSMNGNIVVSTSTNLIVSCSNSNKVLKEWDWFKENRTCPEAWL